MLSLVGDPFLPLGEKKDNRGLKVVQATLKIKKAQKVSEK